MPSFSRDSTRARRRSSGRDAEGGERGGVVDSETYDRTRLTSVTLSGDRVSSVYDAGQTTEALPPLASSARLPSGTSCDPLQQQELQATAGSSVTVPSTRALSIAQLGEFVSRGLSEGVRSFSQLECAAEAAFAEACTSRRLFLSLLWATTQHNLRQYSPSASTLAHEQEPSLDHDRRTTIALHSDRGCCRHTNCMISLAV